MTAAITPISSTAAPRKAALRKKIAQFGELAPNWDDDNGQPPATQDLKNASDFLDYIPVPGLATVELMVAGDGDVGYEWKTSLLRLEIGFRRAQISFFGENRQTGLETNGDYPATVSCPPELIGFMETVFSGTHLVQKTSESGSNL